MLTEVKLPTAHHDFATRPVAMRVFSIDAAGEAIKQSLDDLAEHSEVLYCGISSSELTNLPGVNIYIRLLNIVKNCDMLVIDLTAKPQHNHILLGILTQHTTCVFALADAEFINMVAKSPAIIDKRILYGAYTDIDEFIRIVLQQKTTLDKRTKLSFAIRQYNRMKDDGK